jgi:hypothetical protein
MPVDDVSRENPRQPSCAIEGGTRQAGARRKRKLMIARQARRLLLARFPLIGQAGGAAQTAHSRAAVLTAP